ncbi:MAG: DUF4422 domain-containing protein [Lachnospiraceae bacterium]|nr:DUF4422 domain-containing protein [Lachnospiraceae bacterium]
MQIIIYGKGKLFQSYRKVIDWSQIVAIADKNVGTQELIEGKQVIIPEKIQKLQYDYIVIFSDTYFYDIRRELIGEYFIEPERIVSWRFLLREESEADIFSFIKKTIKIFHIKSMLDVGMSIISNYIFSMNEMLPETEFVMDGVGIPAFLFYKQIYGNIYDKLDDVNSFYDLVYINNGWTFDTHALEKLRNEYKYVLLRVSYVDYSKEKVQSMYSLLQQYGKVRRFYLEDSIYFLIIAENETVFPIDIQIFVATHRPYNLLNNELYRPICIGNKYQNVAYLSEQNGDNISYLNEKINECTALYWIWKNTTSEYVGLNHYRRYFYNNEILSEGNYLNEENIYKIFQEYDIILPQYVLLPNMRVEEQISNTISKEAFEKGNEVIRKGIKKYQPDYLEAFDEVMHGHKVFLCNMFVTRRDILNEYCEWLFSFLIEAAESIDVSQYDNYSKRVIGFLAERMMTVWLLKHNFRIKELPFDIVK